MGTTYRKDVSWLAFSSLLLGVMTFMMLPYFYLSVFPALILAHLGLWRASKSEEPVEGKSIAIVGLVFNYGFLIAFIFLPIVLTYRDDFDKRPFKERLSWITSGFDSKPKFRQADCRKNLKMIGVALHQYAEDNEGVFPGDLSELLNKDLVKDLKHLHCLDRRFYQPEMPESFETDYIYLGAGLRNDHVDASTTIILYDKPENHRGESINILFIDGHTETHKGDSIGKFCRKFGFNLPAPSDP